MRSQNGSVKKSVLWTVAVLFVLIGAWALYMYNFSPMARINDVLSPFTRGTRIVLTPSEALVSNDPAADARNKQRSEDAEAILSALKVYYAATGSYPETYTELVPAYLTARGGNELGRVDPSTNQPYEYQVDSNNKSFQLCVTFEPNSRKCAAVTP